MRQDALWAGGPVFYFDETAFPPTMDTFLLGDFSRGKRGERVCDLGAGTGLLGLLLLAREPSLHVTGVELNPAAVPLAEETIRANGLSDRMTLLTADLRQLDGVLPAGTFDRVVCNPPYFQAGSGAAPSSGDRRLAREDAAATIDEVSHAAGRLLRFGGRLEVVFRPERLCDLLCALRTAAVEPKRLRFVQQRADTPPLLLLLEGRRGGRPGLSVEAPLLLENLDGTPSSALDAIYFRDREDAAL
ncbi:MAG: methyltransferase [Oscillospiraceae bacterium]